MKTNKIIFSILFTFALILILNELSLAQCAMCRATIENNVKNQSGAGKGLNGGILYLMSFPYIVISLVAFFWYKSSKKDTDKHNRFVSLLKRKLS